MKPEMKMFLDNDEDRLIVWWKGYKRKIPMTNVASYNDEAPVDRKIVQTASPQVAGITSAQVETPMSHVHAGPGHGKKGK